MIYRAFYRLNPSQIAFMTYASLKYFASPSGKIEFTSVPTMAEWVGISVSSFQRGVRELVKKGAVKIHRRRRKTPAGQKLSLPNLYELVKLSPNDPDEDF
jgi:hypothetical protein